MITILLPALNEQLAIKKTIQEVRDYVPNAQIIVVDGYSTDKTVEYAQQSGAEVIMAKERGNGKGLAVRTALELIKSDYVVMLDSDFTYPASYINEIVCNLELGYNVVMGYRKYREADSMPLINALGNAGLSFIASVVCKKYVHDLCTGMWGFDKYALNRFCLSAKGFTLEADLFKNAVRSHCKIKQMPITYRARLKDSKTKLNVGHGVEIAKFLIRG